MQYELEVKVFGLVHKYRPVLGAVKGHWTANRSMAQREGDSMLRAAHSNACSEE